MNDKKFIVEIPPEDHFGKLEDYLNSDPHPGYRLVQIVTIPRSQDTVWLRVIWQRETEADSR